MPREIRITIDSLALFQHAMTQFVRSSDRTSDLFKYPAVETEFIVRSPTSQLLHAAHEIVCGRLGARNGDIRWISPSYLVAPRKRRQIGIQTEPLFLRTSTGTEIEARAERVFHPHGRFVAGDKRFDILLLDLASDPSLAVPEIAEAEDAFNSVVSLDEVAAERDERIIVGYHGLPQLSTPERI